MSSKSKLALLDDNNFPVNLIEVGGNIRDVSEKEKKLKELADSIESYGQLEPIGIEIEENENEKFKLVYGHRRFIAITKILKWKSIKVVRIIGSNRVETQLIENIHRKDLNDLELAEALHKIQVQTKSKNKDLAKLLSKSVDWIESKNTHWKTFNSLDSETKKIAKDISTDKIKPLQKLSNDKRKEVVSKIKNEKLSVKAIREEVKKHSEKSETSRKSEPKESKAEKISNLKKEIKDLETKLSKKKSELETLQGKKK